MIFDVVGVAEEDIVSGVEEVSELEGPKEMVIWQGEFSVLATVMGIEGLWYLRVVR